MTESMDSTRIPDEILFKIFSNLPSVRDRMRLSLVSKRVSRLVYSKPMWNDINLFSLHLSDLSATINGHKFSLLKRSNAFQVFIDCCAPFTRAHISIDPNSSDVFPIKHFLGRFQNAQSTTNAQLTELNFVGSLEYEFAPIVFETLVAKDGSKQSVKVCTLGNEINQIVARKFWSQISLCTGLKRLHLDSVKSPPFQLFDDSARRALAGKESLQMLSIQNPHIAEQENFERRIGAVVNSCPLLTALCCNGFSSFALFRDILSPQVLGRLERLDLCARSPPQFAMIESWPLKLPCLKYSVITVDFDDIFIIVENFLDIWHAAESPKFVKLDFQSDQRRHNDNKRMWGRLGSEIEKLGALCDNVDKTTDGRTTFTKGSAVIACKFIHP